MEKAGLCHYEFYNIPITKLGTTLIEKVLKGPEWTEDEFMSTNNYIKLILSIY